MGNRGIDFIDDQRFIRFIKTRKELNNLVCLIGATIWLLMNLFNHTKLEKSSNKTALVQIVVNQNIK